MKTSYISSFSRSHLAVAVLAVSSLTACTSGPSVAELDALTDSVVKSSFRTQGQAKVERLTQTD